MAKFKFSKSTIEIEIEDHVFTVDINDEILFKLDENGKEAIKYSEKSGRTERELVDETVEFVKKSLDLLLGEGSYDDIFGVRPVSYIEHVEVWSFVVTEIREASENRRKDFEKGASKYNAKRIKK